MPSWLKKVFWWMLIGFMLVGAVAAWRWYRNSLQERKRAIRQKRDEAEVKHKVRLQEAQKEESHLLQAIWTEFNFVINRITEEEKEVDAAIEAGPVGLAVYWNDNILGDS